MPKFYYCNTFPWKPWIWPNGFLPGKTVQMWSEGGSQDCDITAVAMCWEWVPYWAGWAVHCHHAPKFFKIFFDIFRCAWMCGLAPETLLCNWPETFKLQYLNRITFCLCIQPWTFNLQRLNNITFSLCLFLYFFLIMDLQSLKKNQKNYFGIRFRLCSGVWHLPHLKSLKSFLETKKEEKPFVLVLMLACFTD